MVVPDLSPQLRVLQCPIREGCGRNATDFIDGLNKIYYHQYFFGGEFGGYIADVHWREPLPTRCRLGVYLLGDCWYMREAGDSQHRQSKQNKRKSPPASGHHAAVPKGSSIGIVT